MAFKKRKPYKKKILTPGQAKQRSFLLELARNFENLAKGSEGRGYPGSTYFFDKKAENCKNLAYKIR